MSWNNQYQPPQQYPPYQGAPPQPYPQQQQQYGGYPGQSGYPQQQQGGYPQQYNQGPPSPQQYNQGPPPPGQYNNYGAPPPPPQQYGNQPPQIQQQQFNQQPQYNQQPPMTGGPPMGGPPPMWFLGVPVSPLEGMNMGQPSPPPPGYDAAFDVERIRKATKGFGTDEKSIIAAMAPLDAIQMNALSVKYNAMIGKTLVHTLEKETSGWLENGLRGLALGPLGWDVWLIHRACAGAGTHEDLLSEMILGRTNAEMYLLKAAYQAVYHKDLVQVVKGELSAKTERLFIMALAGDRDENPMVNHQLVQHDVEDLYRAGEGKLGTDEIKIASILVTRSIPHLQALNQAYQQRYHHPISRMIEKEFGGHMKEALVFIARGFEQDGQGVERDAEMMEEAMAGMGTKDERLSWRIIRAHWNRPRFEAIKQAYHRKYGKSLGGRVQGETSGDYERLLLAVIQ